jgi:hypothetical protein
MSDTNQAETFTERVDVTTAQVKFGPGDGVQCSQLSTETPSWARPSRSSV